MLNPWYSVQGIAQSMRLVHDRLCPRGSCRVKLVFNMIYKN